MMNRQQAANPLTVGAHRGLRTASPARRVIVCLGISVALVLPAACGGSAISPEDAAAANRAVQGLVGINGGNVAGDTPIGGPVSDGPEDVPGSPATDTPLSPGQQPSGGTSGRPGTPNAPAGSDVKAASCAGLKNTTGITDKSIIIGNVSDISGPIPGLFSSTQQAVKAYVRYYNQTNPRGICGRSLELQTQDSRTDAGADQIATTKACNSVFATVGSMSAFDSGGASVAQGCGLPEIRTASTTDARAQCSTCFSAHSTGVNETTNAEWDFYVQNYPTAVKKAAILYLSAGAASSQAKTMKSVSTKRGFQIIYFQGIDVATFDYSSYVQAMKSKGVEYVRFIGAVSQTVRLQRAMQQANFKPQVYAAGPGIYESNYLETGGSAVEGTTLYIDFVPFEERQAELDQYKLWLQQVAPGAEPTFYGIFAWSAAKLFVQQALKLGGKLTRASLVGSLKTVHAWTGGDMHSAMDIGGKHYPSCIRFMQVKNNKFVPLKSTKYMCRGTSKG
jgi:ABC-type branched-subunit amino acid transport system substrate-binding protein